MKKPIDPNLNDSFDLDGLDLTAAEDIIAGTKNTYNADDVPTNLTLNETDKKDLRTHHRHSSSHSSGSHSSGSHHNNHSVSHRSSGSSGSSGSHSSHSSSGKKSTKKKKEKMPVAARIAIVFLVIIFLFVAGGVGAIFILERMGKNDMTSNTTEQTSYEEVIEYNGHKYAYNEDIVAIAFIGVDKRQLSTTGTIGTAGQADADLVMTINTNTGKAKVIAIPRDTMVDVDLYSENNIFLRSEKMQLCLSFAYGNGRDTSAQNVTTSMSRILYNVPINKYFVLDLDGIAPINDAIGGVTVESLYDFNDLGIKKGDTVHLQGDLTEAYVRTRDMDTIDASLNRTSRQIQYIKAFAAQALPAVVNDFGIVSRLYNTAADYSTTNMNLSNVTYLASLLLSKGITDFETVTLQGEMQKSTNSQYAEHVYAEFYHDNDSTLQTVLDTFYTQVD